MWLAPSTRLCLVPLPRFTGEERRLRGVYRTIAIALFAVLSIAASAPNDPADRLRDPVQEARARALFREVRCLVCQNESIDDSEADLAGDLRQAVRAQVAAGRSDAEVKRYLVDRYGEFVLLKPALSLGNAVLWLAPLLLVMGGGAVLLWRARGDVEPTQPLTAEEETALARLDVAPPAEPGPGSAA